MSCRILIVAAASAAMLLTPPAWAGRFASASVQGETPLHLAAASSRTERIQVLLKERANANAQDATGETPLHRAAAPQSNIPDVAVYGCIELLVEAGADPNARSRDGATPLDRAARSGSEAAALALIAAGADPDAGALHMAAASGHAGMARLLLEAGARPQTLDSLGRTAMQHATRVREAVDTRGVIEVLRRYGAED